MANIEQAITIAAKAHAGIKDKQGKPYVLHPLRVMMGVEGDVAEIVAVLHDVVEDTPVSLKDIRAAGFREEVLDALALVTHDESQSYLDYVIGCKKNETARQVKLSDLRDNANLSRMLLRPDKFDGDARRMQRYALSYRFLLDEITEDQYRQLMVHLE